MQLRNNWRAGYAETCTSGSEGGSEKPGLATDKGAWFLPYKPEENGYAERLMRTIKEEEVDLSEYEDFHAAYWSIGRFLDEVYSRKRIHSALGYLTPAEFEADWQAKQPEPVLK